MLKLFNKHISDSFRFGPTFKSFYGISIHRSKFFCKKIGVPYTSNFITVPFPSQLFFSKIFIKKFFLNPFAERTYVRNISFKIRSGSYHGFCIANNIPSRGQRSKTNGRTAQRALIKQLLSKFA
jgi:ribosomal protein S13